jgi:hypothetical protein
MCSYLPPTPASLFFKHQKLSLLFSSPTLSLGHQ